MSGIVTVLDEVLVSQRVTRTLAPPVSKHLTFFSMDKRYPVIGEDMGECHNLPSSNHGEPQNHLKEKKECKIFTKWRSGSASDPL